MTYWKYLSSSVSFNKAKKAEGEEKQKKNLKNPRDQEQAETHVASTSAGHQGKQNLLGNNDFLLVHILYKNNEYTTYISEAP